VNKERKIRIGVDNEFWKFERLIGNSNFFEGLIRNLPFNLLIGKCVVNNM
jgi:hypothetical protein